MPLPHNLFDYCSIRKSNFIEKYLVVKRKISFVYKADILLTKLIIRGVMPLTQNLQLRQQAGIEKWSRLIAEQKNSGLTIQDFCRQHDLSWHAYYYWLRKYVSISSRNYHQVLLKHKRYLPNCQCMINYLLLCLLPPGSHR